MNTAPGTDQDWASIADGLSWESRPYIDGAFRDPASTETFQGTNPADESPGIRFCDGNAEDVSRAVRGARQAFDAGPWGQQGPQFRKRVLHQFADLIDNHAESLALGDCLDMGKPIAAAIQEVGIAAAFIRYYAEALDKVYIGQAPPAGPGSLELQIRRPRGVVAAIIPWNFPVINATLKLGPILAAGNTVVVKPSELSPRSALKLAELATEAGLPDGVLNVVPGAGQTGDALTRHSGVDMIAFTGSTGTGKALLRAVGDSTIKPLLLECGGKSPELVLPDMANADLAGIAAAVVRGAFWNQGQVCVARSRLLLHESIYEPLLEQVLAAAGAIQPGDPLQAGTMFGPLASARQRDVVESYIQQGIDAGAELLLDGRGVRSPGYYVAPTVFGDVSPDSTIAQEEIFGPVLSVFRFRDVADAIALANSTDYGLAATLWTRDIGLAHQLSQSIRAGMVRVASSPLPTEGAGLSHAAEAYGQSGFGVEGGIKGLETYTRLQSVEFSFGQ
jgi:gamma-glutamyl-gamma-aminobutyraldehyde dehydrogenase